MTPRSKIIAGPARWLSVVAFTAALAACSLGEPAEYTAIDEIPSGPGLLTGAEGEFTLYR